MLKPLGDKVVVELMAPSEKSAGGLILPIATRENQQINKGKVVAVGPGRQLDDGRRMRMSVKVGDYVLINWGGTDVEIGKEKFRILTEGDILAIMD